MNKLFYASIVIIFGIYPSLLLGKTIYDDVTGDGFNDEIYITNNRVVVIAGQTKTRYPSINVQIGSCQVKNFLPETNAKEIAITTNRDGKYTMVYAFQNDSFPAVSDLLPGEIDIENNTVYGYGMHGWGFKIIYPIINENGILKIPEPQKKVSETIEIAAGNKKTINIDIPRNSLVTYLVAVENNDINVAIASASKKGEPIRIDRNTPYYFKDYYSNTGLATLAFDNSYPTSTAKNVFYEVIAYNIIPPNEAIIAQIKHNMHTVQLAAEDYCTIHEGLYPKNLSEFIDLLLPMENPVNNEIPPVVYGIDGKPGQVCYTYNYEKSMYRIYGIDGDGNKLDLVLSSQ